MKQKVNDDSISRQEALKAVEDIYNALRDITSRHLQYPIMIDLAYRYLQYVMRLTELWAENLKGMPSALPMKPNTMKAQNEHHKKDDPVNHPAHYTDGRIEVIEFIEDRRLGYCLGNAVKYISRAGKKDPEKEVEDLRKAVWYIERRIKELLAYGRTDDNV